MKGTNMKTVLSIIAIFAIAIVAYSLNNSNNNNEDLAYSETSSNIFEIKDVKKGKEGYAVDFSWDNNGKQTTFAEYTKGKVVFLNFWGTWCPPCRREIPDIVKLHNELGSNVVFIGITLGDTKAKVEDFNTKAGIKYFNFLAKNGDPILEAYGRIPSVPTTFIIDKSGKITSTIVGSRDYATFQTEIKKAMN